MKEINWKTHKNQKDGFSVVFPDNPKFSDSSDNLTSAHLYYTSDTNGIAYQVCKVDYQPKCSMLNRPKRNSLIILAQQLIYNELVNDVDEVDFISWKGHKIIKYFALRKRGGDYKGDGSFKDYGMLKDKRSYIKGLIILLGSTAYILTVTGVEKNVDDDNYNKFINSFKIPLYRRYSLIASHSIKKLFNSV